MNNKVYDYIIAEANTFETTPIQLTRSKTWSMKEHIERCTNVANGWFHNGKNDGQRPYEDIVTPIVDVAFRSEGFDVKDIVPFVNEAKNSYKSFLIKKYHPKWARKNELDSFIDEVVESSIIYDLVLIKNVNNVRPEVVPLENIAFCDQTDVMKGPICIKDYYNIPDLLAMKGKWDAERIDEAIIMAQAEKEAPLAKERKNKTPGKYIEVFELHGMLPENWLDENGSPNKYTPQLHIVCYYTNKDGDKNGITLFKGKSKKMDQIFKALKIDVVRSRGRACGRSVVERLFEPQVWRNYSAIKLKQLMDAAITVFQTSDPEIANQPLSAIKPNTVLKHQDGKPLTKVDGTVQNTTLFENNSTKMENSARILGSANEAQLGLNPASGVPLGTTQIVTSQGQGIHEYRQGKISTFFADVLYRDWILQYLVDDMNQGKSFSEILTTEEMMEVAEAVVSNQVEKQITDLILKGQIVTEADRANLMQLYRTQFMKGGNRKFFEILEDELKDIPMDVMVNISAKQRNMAQNADKLTNIIREVIRNPGAFAQIPGLGGVFNQLIEESGFSPIDFTKITRLAPVASPPLEQNQ